MLNSLLKKRIDEFLKEYTHMSIGGVVIHCPYWMNKINAGVVIVRGYENGKGEAHSIKEQLEKLIFSEKSEDRKIDALYIQKLAKRNRIGIDCSGFAYRFLDYILKETSNAQNGLDGVFKDGINRTNVKKFIDQIYAIKISSVKEIKIGDIISTRNGKHMLVVFDKTDSEIHYVNSSHKHTQIKGVHTSKIEIKDPNLTIERQKWHEKSENGVDYQTEHYFLNSVDGIYRLRIFT